MSGSEMNQYKTGTNATFWAYLYGPAGIIKNLVTNNYHYQDGSGSTSHLVDSSGNLIEWYRYDLQVTRFRNSVSSWPWIVTRGPQICRATSSR